MTSIYATKGDITGFTGDAIVNAANPQLAGGGGVDGAIHSAGGPAILAECREWVAANGNLPTGEAMITGAGDLDVEAVIHTVGPVWAEHDEDNARRLLAACYRNSLDLAMEHGLRSIAFPNISTGVYGFPKEEAAQTAMETVQTWVANEPGLEEVVFVCFDEGNLRLYSRLADS